MEINPVLNTLKIQLLKPVKAAPIAVFRVLFGVMMMYSAVRFVAKGWVEQYYIKPVFHFTYYGFNFVTPLGSYTYLLWVILFLSALFLAVGLYYRIAAILFFLTFTYIELIDKTYYLNHYYFVSLIGFLFIFLPANSTFSLDAKRNPKMAYQQIPRYNIFAIQFMLCIVYFYAGLAKINSDWLLRAMPLKIWLTANYNLPLLGSLIQHTWIQYAISWMGMLFDLIIPFLLFCKRTRIFGYVLVVVFHLLTKILFPIGIFPIVMIFSTLIFFDAGFHEKIIRIIQKILKIKPLKKKERILAWQPNLKQKLSAVLLIVFFIVQLIYPFRYLLYPGELFWTEEGFRFSWRVMLIDKVGIATFKIVNPETGHYFYVNNDDYLTRFQKRQMNTQPDFILQYARFLAHHYEKQGIKTPQVFVDSYITLNGRSSRRYISPNVDLAQKKESFKHKTWILPFNDKIYGF